MSGVVAIVPLRDGTSGKSRLAESFSPENRTRLISEMARHVVDTLNSSGEIDTILVVTRDPESALQSLGSVGKRVQIVRQPDDAIGLNGALEFGRCRAVTGGASGVLIVPADLPLLSTEDVRALVVRPDAMVIAPDRRMNGTNALFLPNGKPPGDPTIDGHCSQFVFQFGEGSYAAHIAEGARLGLDDVTLILDGTALDLDTIDDWQSLPVHARAAMARALASPYAQESTQDSYSCVVESTTRTAMFPWS